MNVHILEVNASPSNPHLALHPVVLADQQEKLLVDCGYAGFLPLLEKSLHEHGLTFRDLTGIIITHHDTDHMGALFEIRQQYPLLKVFSSQEEEQFISGKTKSLRLEQAERLFDSLPEEQRAHALLFQNHLKSLRPVPVDFIFPQQGKSSFAGIEIIHTPGHMPGHISLYLPQAKTLIAADALVYENGELDIANPTFALDLAAAVESVKRIRQLAVEKIICYHGGLVEKDIPAMLDRLLKRYQ